MSEKKVKRKDYNWVNRFHVVTLPIPVSITKLERTWSLAFPPLIGNTGILDRCLERVLDYFFVCKSHRNSQLENKRILLDLDRRKKQTNSFIFLSSQKEI